MSRNDARRPEDADVTSRQWLNLIAEMDGAVIPCRQGAAEFHSTDPTEQARAARLCGACSIRQVCLAFALASGQTTGVWGGTTPTERKRIRRERKGRAA